MYMSGYGMGGMWLLWLLPLLAVLIYVALARNNGSGRSRALDILDERLAKGEIDTETYEKLKEALQRKG